MYVSYDIKGIQQFVYSIPRLRYVIGGSGLVTEFDRHWEDPTNLPQQVTLIFSGGGRGAFHCRHESAIKLIKRSLIESAHLRGLDIRIGTDGR